MEEYPRWHREIYIDQLPPAPPGRATRAWRRLRAALRRTTRTR